MPKSIVLTGMMGSGKSTVGRIVADRLGRDYIDTDREIERQSGMSVIQIFADHGEEKFRELERRAVRTACDGDDRVIGLGGGAVLDDGNLMAVQRTGVVVMLEAPIDALSARIVDDPGRPLLAEGDVGLKLSALARKRAGKYAEAADHTVDATSAPERVAQAILDWAAERPGVLTDEEREVVA